MYSEFIEGTCCKDNQHNYEVFKNLEVMYMNSDMTKEQVYEYGRQLVNNEKSAEQIELEKEIEAEIEQHKRQIEYWKSEIAWKEQCIAMADGDQEWIKDCKRMIRNYKEHMKQERNEVRALKWVLE